MSEQLNKAGQMLSEYKPMASSAPLIVYVDFKSPYAYLAVEPTRRLLAELGVVADWRPFVLDIASYLGSAKLDKSGKVEKQNRSQEQWSGVKYAYFDCRRYANLSGLTIRGTVKIWNTDLPAIGMWWLKQFTDVAAQCQPDGLLQRYIDAIYVPFWQRALDAEDPQVILNALTQIDAPTEGFLEFARDQGEGAGFNKQFQQQAFNAGVYGVPTFVLPNHLDNTGQPQKYFGREHLPRIQWSLGGEHGEAPDIAYTLNPDIDDKTLALSASDPGAVRQADGAAPKLVTFFDFKSPQSYLALAPAQSIKEDGIELEWHPFDSTPLKQPAAFVDGEDRGTRHHRMRGEYIAVDIHRYAPHELKDIYRHTDCAFANMGLLWLRYNHPKLIDGYVARVFDRLWRDNAEIESAQAIGQVLAELVVNTDLADADAFHTEWLTYIEGKGRDDWQQAKTFARNSSVNSAPTFMIGSEPFQGRAQLPLVRSRLLAGI
jgi:2-hydroxychromene-2-carboxylate isomerase